MLALMMDGIVAALLIVTIGFAIRLNGRLGSLHKERANMERLVSGLHTASRQAEEAVAGLRAAAMEHGQPLQAIMDKAAGLKSDLEFLMDKGNELADRLENGIKPNRAKATSVTPPTVVPILSEIRPGTAPEMDGVDQETSSRLAAILRRVEQGEEPEPKHAKPPKPRGLIAPPPKDRGADDNAATDQGRTESRAERDLKRALEGRR